MIDISDKYLSKRIAVAKGSIFTKETVINNIKNNKDLLSELIVIAKNSGKMFAKKASDLIFDLNRIPLDYVEIDVNLSDFKIEVSATLKTVWKAGVEIEAVTAVNGALLNIYNYLIEYDKDAEIGKIKLEKKKGGQASFNDNFEKPIKTAVVVVSDSVLNGKKEDKAGQIILNFLKNYDLNIEDYKIIPENEKAVNETFEKLINEQNIELILTSGGTGPGKKDIVSNVTDKFVDKKLPGIGEAIRSFGKDRTPFAMISCESGGVKDKSLIVNLPGSSNGAIESLQSIFPGLLHIFPIINEERRKNKKRRKK